MAKFCSRTASQLNELIGIWILWPGQDLLTLQSRKCHCKSQRHFPIVRTTKRSTEFKAVVAIKKKKRKPTNLWLTPRVSRCLLNISGSAESKSPRAQISDEDAEKPVQTSARYLHLGDNDAASSLAVSFYSHFSFSFFFLNLKRKWAEHLPIIIIIIVDAWRRLGSPT